MRDRGFSYICFALAIAEIIVIVGSWVVGVLMPDSGMRSMLASDSIRWFFSNFTSFVSGKVLAWILLLSMAWNSVKACGIFSKCHSINDRHSQLTINDKVAMACSVVALCFCVAVVLLLTAVPHAALLSVSGSLYPSPFSKSFVAIVSFIAIFTSIVYGVMSGRYHHVADVFVPLRVGVAKSAWLVVIYIFAAQLFYTLLYIQNVDI